ncbi:universal stress protein [Psychroserpens sp.]|uniref:universal stress protein n=1 Tax=Psychroserpens sp. TaxID=2020870 RepID=UPI00385B3259
MKNILLPTDFSDNSWNAIKYAIAFFEDYTCNFYILHANQIADLAVNDSSYILSKEEIEDSYIKPTQLKLKQLISRISESLLKRENHNFHCISEYNFLITSIRKNIEEKHIDYIIMGTKGATGLKEIILGTNTADVITKVKCNTLVIPENSEFVKPKEIGFATDFSLSHDLDILRPIKHTLNYPNTSLHILHIKEKHKELNDDQKLNKKLLENYFKNFSIDFHFLTNKKIEDAIQCFAQSRNIDMFYMVGKNLNYFEHILFHSKVEKISYHTDIPFFVLHEKK